MRNKKYTVLENQTLLDIALQELGDAIGILTLAEDNNIGLTDDLEAGQILLIDQDKILVPEIVNYYQAKNIFIATKTDDIQPPIIPKPKIFDKTFDKTFN